MVLHYEPTNLTLLLPTHRNPQTTTTTILNPLSMRKLLFLLFLVTVKASAHALQFTTERQSHMQSIRSLKQDLPLLAGDVMLCSGGGTQLLTYAIQANGSYRPSSASFSKAFKVVGTNFAECASQVLRDQKAVEGRGAKEV